MDLNDVELNDANQDRVDRLVDSTLFDRDEAEAIVRFGKVDESDRDPSQIWSFVSDGEGNAVEDGLTPDECDRIRRNMGKASRPKTVIDAWPSKHPSVIFRHATGRCDHDGDADPVTSPRIEPDECREMRVGFQTGDDVEDIRTEFNRSSNAVVKHVFGRCGHHFDRSRQARGRGVSAAACDRMRRAYRANDFATTVDIGRAFVVDQSTASRHLRGKCDHDDDPSEPPIDGGVTPTKCQTIRHEYRTRGVESVASIIDRMGLTKGTFYYHLKGKCSHTHDVDPVDPTA